ncbi:DUF2290 domain-containing protein [Niastella caeni]|uniref:DUF2290 domain-containing protein n=1 Tax=Niastella caeni TaxID=2569763 RepID=A0A4V4GZJ7_9BACT|nr:DUF2290 domain-containing protein [Niastella caeni]THU33006.1 DUF2290 domain-containing protein [Niastella caeni]
MTINDTYQEIVTITQQVIESGLSVQEKWPERNGSRITWNGQNDISIALKNIPYAEKYTVLESDQNFNFKMIDGALIQFMYEFNQTGRKLESHRLAFLPSPKLEHYDSAPEDYEELHFGQSEFHDMIEKNIVAFPIRFDYNENEEFFKEIDHPYSHVSFGEYEFCRIPVNRPITPSIFISFVLRNFYSNAVRSRGEICAQSKFRFDMTITNNEKNILHFNID